MCLGLLNHNVGYDKFNGSFQNANRFIFVLAISSQGNVCSDYTLSIIYLIGKTKQWQFSYKFCVNDPNLANSWGGIQYDVITMFVYFKIIESNKIWIVTLQT